MNNKWGFNKIGNFFKLQSFKLKGKKKNYMYAALGTLIYSGAFLYLLQKKMKGQMEIKDIYYQSLTKGTKQLSNIKIPTFFRTYLYTLYAQKYGVNLEEIQLPLIQYQNFSQFFTRKIKARQSNQLQINNSKTICCPCDSQILNICKVTEDKNIIVKDINYSLNKLLFGKQTEEEKENEIVGVQFGQKQNDMYQVIFYLSPGDYHRFHAPADIMILTTRQIGSRLKPVNITSLLKSGGKIYEQNARKILHCCYSNTNPNTNPYNQRYLGLVMIGALNVSDIVINENWEYKKGEEIGYFNLGSTIVMFIESDKKMKWNKKVGDKVKFGQNLCEFL